MLARIILIRRSANVLAGGGAESSLPIHALLAAALVLRIHLFIVDGLATPLVWDLPDAELAVLARREEHILQLIVVNHPHLVREARLEHSPPFSIFWQWMTRSLPVE